MPAFPLLNDYCYFEGGPDLMKLIKDTVHPRCISLSFRQFFILTGLLGCFSFCRAQAVTEVITDFGGYWKTGTSSINPVKPNNSHNLLAFSFNGLRYSTGVDDATLSSHGEVYMAEDFRALPVRSLSGKVNGNTKIGLGASYDNVSNGSSHPPPENNIQKYLTDGSKGLDIGTGAANLPSGPIVFGITKLEINAIGDGVPDILVTQFADPSGSTDRYEFTDSSGNRVGNYVNISFSHIAPVGNWTADFYEASEDPMTLTSGYTHTDRPLRLWAADFSDFGIDQEDLSRIANFKITLNGNSDVAFVAYNYNTFNIGLPVRITDFIGKLDKGHAQLGWKAVQESKSISYIIEKSKDGISYQPIQIMRAKADGSGVSMYHYTDPDYSVAETYYRINIIERGEHSHYSKVISLASAFKNNSINCFPNPAKEFLYIAAGTTHTGGKIEILNIKGRVVLQKKLAFGNDVIRLNTGELQPAMYIVRIHNGTFVRSALVMVGL